MWIEKMKKLVCVDFQKKKKRKEEKKKSLVCVDWEMEKAKETIGSLIPMKAFSLRKKRKMQHTRKLTCV